MKQYKNTVNTITHITKTPTQLSKHPHTKTAWLFSYERRSLNCLFCTVFPLPTGC